MKKTIFARIFLVFSFLLLAACSNSLPANRCLLPVVTSIPETMGQQRGESESIMDVSNTIPSWWQIQPNSLAPFKIIPKDIFLYGGVGDVAVIDETIWFGLLDNIVRYNLETGETKYYPNLDNENNAYTIFDLLGTQDGELWALVLFPEKNLAALAHYNPQADQFEFVDLVSDGKQITQEKDRRDLAFSITAQVLVETPDGNILLPFGENMVSYNPDTHKTQRLLPDDFQFHVSAIVVYENKAWFTVGRFLIPPITNQDMDLRSVDLKTGEIVNYGHAASIVEDKEWSWYMNDSYRPIAVDRLGRIWMGYFARLKLGPDKKYTWEKVTYPPEFVVADDPDFSYLWASVDSIYTSPDGNLWFKSSAGLIEYDANKDKWCISVPSSIAAALTTDAKGNFWMAARDERAGYLYKYDSNP